MNTLPTGPSWAGNRINYGKGRCAYVPKAQQAAAQAVQAAVAISRRPDSLVAHSGPMQLQISHEPLFVLGPDSGGMGGGNGMNSLSGNDLPW